MADDLDLDAPDYPPGAPCWLDLLATDVTWAREFYSAVLDWQWREGDESTGGYTLAMLGDHPVAGLSRRPADAPVPSQWTTYLAVRDLEASSRTVADAGGRVLGRPARLGPLATTAIVRDPGGAHVGLWQAGTLRGCGVLDEPGALAWNELLTREYEPVQAFAGAAFDHRFEEEGEPTGPRWAMARTSDGNPAYGLSEIGPQFPADIRAHWLVAFATTSVVPSVAAVLEHGGSLVQGPYDGPFGVAAVVRGPEGETFSLLVTDD
ncbi:VOC family protein [Terracoccus luteus]|uniref:VOC domain-containing protein n=1 Tax=Terracoccus luteus TaxID=53356 RepID=A0A839PWW8_9MICO|nr:VOC family protein [Terracoccus luteus]MBB2987583.1 hypothetical protein [Terracoccus luteus]MCP2173234.1 hypothetical protein [Terracoccus luteus]